MCTTQIQHDCPWENGLEGEASTQRIPSPGTPRKTSTRRPRLGWSCRGWCQAEGRDREGHRDPCPAAALASAPVPPTHRGPVSSRLHGLFPVRPPSNGSLSPKSLGHASKKVACESPTARKWTRDPGSRGANLERREAREADGRAPRCRTHFRSGVLGRTPCIPRVLLTPGQGVQGALCLPPLGLAACRTA